MTDINDRAEKKNGEESSTVPEAAPAPRLPGVAAVPFGGVRIGAEPDPQSKGQRKHLRRQKEAGKAKVPSRRSRVSR